MEPERTPAVYETALEVGPRSIDAYSRLSYSMWYALAEFIDNSTQSRFNYSSIIDDVLKAEGKPLVVEITHNRPQKTLTISDNSIGMRKEDLVDALRVAQPTKDSKGRSQYGMGLKTAACWIGKRWKVVTCEWDSGEEWTADVDVKAVALEGKKIPLTMRPVGTDEHYTHVIISDLHRNIQTRTEETIRSYLGSMYRFDLRDGRLKLIYNGTEITAPDEYVFDTDQEGRPLKRDVNLVIGEQENEKNVRGWVAILRKGGRKYGGFSLFREQRQIQGFPNAWKPKSIFGGVDDEGANNLIAQRLTGLLELEDGFQVSHTKDAIQWEGDDEEELEKKLFDLVKDYRDYAVKRRGEKGQAWSREKVRELLDSMKAEFTSGEMKDAVNNTILPPLDTIIKNNIQQVATLAEEEKVATLDVLPDLRVVVWMQERSEHDPHLTITAGAEQGTIHVIINGIHPYYFSLSDKGLDAMDECIRQYIYDAIAEYRVSKLAGPINPNSVRRLKNELLKAQIVQIENAATAIQDGAVEALRKDQQPGAATTS